MVQSGSVPTDPPPEAKAQERILLMEEIEKEIVQEINKDKLNLECPKCLMKGTLNSQGVGGSATITAHRQIQMGCTHCRSKTVLRLVLEHNNEHVKRNARVVEMQKQLSNLKDTTRARGRTESTGTKRVKLSSKERSKERAITSFLTSTGRNSPVLSDSSQMAMEVDDFANRATEEGGIKQTYAETTIRSLREIIADLKEELKIQREMNKSHLELISQLKIYYTESNI